MLWPIEDGRGCEVPAAARSVVVPLLGERPALGAPPSFDAIDAADVDVVVWDWSRIAFADDPIQSASIVSIPPLLAIGPITVLGQLVQTYIGPMTTTRPTVEVKCAVQFRSSRVLDWGVELSIQNL